MLSLVSTLFLRYWAAITSLVPPLPGGSERADGLPNVVLITIDTLRADHLSSYGYHLKTSPRIDQLAEEPRAPNHGRCGCSVRCHAQHTGLC